MHSTGWLMKGVSGHPGRFLKVKRTGMSDTDQSLVDEQVRYYRQRASEYDDWFFRRNRYDRGPDHTLRWRNEIQLLRNLLGGLAPSGRILELACGSGLWTEQLARHATSLTAIDTSPEMLALNRARVGSNTVRYQQGDIFRWEPAELYDFIFFGFWLSHVPPSRFAAFWQKLRSSLAPGGRVYFVDNYSEVDRCQVAERRSLSDGRSFTIVKVSYELEALASRLRSLGWDCTCSQTPSFFFCGTAMVST